jgi:ubiquinol-cytochrome c reductase cytochrome b subunit
MDAWSGAPIPTLYLKGHTALQRQGALVFQAKQCHNCHALGGTGGKRGPELDRVAVELTEDQLIRQVIQGGGNMPAYGNNLSPAQTTALVAFLETLHPARQAPAQDASMAVFRYRSPWLWLSSRLSTCAVGINFGVPFPMCCRCGGL